MLRALIEGEASVEAMADSPGANPAASAPRGQRRRHLGRKGRRDEFVEQHFKGGRRAGQVVVVLKAREQARIKIAIGDKARNAGVCKS